MINLTISGRVGQDAKELDNNCVFSIASTKKGFTNRDGKVIEDRTIWFNVFAHKKLAQYIKKGNSMTIYTDFIGTQVYEGKAQLSCNAVDIYFGGNTNNQSNQSQSQQVQEPQQEQQQSDENSELPF